MELYFKDLWWPFILLAVASYIIGNVNFAIIISKLKNKAKKKRKKKLEFMSRVTDKGYRDWVHRVTVEVFEPCQWHIPSFHSGGWI